MSLANELMSLYNFNNVNELMKEFGISFSSGLYIVHGNEKFKDFEEALEYAQESFKLSLKERKEKEEKEKQEKREKLSKSIEEKKWEDLPIEVIHEEANNIILTSSFYVANKEIEKEIEIITAECVYGMNYFKELFAGFSDTFGGRNKTTQKVFRDARKIALDELRREALMIGADAVIAVSIDYREVSALGKSGALMMVVASGTAVALKE